MKTTTTQTAAQLDAIREQLERADRYPLSQQQIGAVIIAVSALTDLIEKLARQIEETE